MSNNVVQGKAAGGKARAKSLTAARRKEISVAAAKAKAEIKNLPKATHGSADHPLRIGDIEIPCYVLNDGTRVLSQRGFTEGVGMSLGSSRTGDARHIALVESEAVKPHANSDLLLMLKNPIRFQNPRGGGVAYGYPATVLADYCEAVLAARRAGTLAPRQSQVADKCEILVRGFARVGIIALVDEATGYQKDRAKDALAQILEAFVAKELQPYMKTFPADYYEQLFRLYGYTFPPENKRPQWRPAFFGGITNEVIYNRLAPALLPELKKAASKGEKRAKLHQWLTNDIGHPKLKEHLASIVSILKLSKTPEEFRANVNIVHPRYGDTKPLDFKDQDID
jgi:hypothetical protein